MPQQYSGNAALILPAAAVNITSSTFANPTVIQTSAAHNLSTGDYVDIQQHQTNTIANGIWPATFVDATHFSIPVAGTAAGGATGTAQPLSVGASMQQPVDGDSGSAASVLVSLGVLSDRTAFLGLGTGQYKLASRSISYLNDATFGASWCHIPNGGLTAGTVYQWVSDGAGWSSPNNALSVPNVGGVAPAWSFFGLASTDLLVATLQSTIALNGQSPIRVLLYAAAAAPGVTPTWPGGYGKMYGASLAAGISGAPAAYYAPFTLQGAVGGLGTGNVYIQPVLMPYITASQSPQLVGDSTLTLDIWRPTGMPQ